MSLFPNLITMRVMDNVPCSLRRPLRHCSRDLPLHGRGQPARDHRLRAESGDRRRLSQLMKPGQALMSLPAVSPDPFIYDGFRP